MTAELPKRLAPLPPTFRELYLKSGNLCAYPGCTALMMNEDGDFIGQVCHIQAAEPGGERFNPKMTNDERRAASNLMLMCYPHHVGTNDVAKFSVARLQQMKAAHERRFSGCDRAMREKLARLKWSALFASGVVAGAGIAGMVEQFQKMLSTLIRPRHQPQGAPKPLRDELLQVLRYGPRGAMSFYSRDPLHLAAGEAFAEVFQQAGWYIARSRAIELSQAINKLDIDKGLMTLFTVRDKHQCEMAKQTIDEFFDVAGFEKSSEAAYTANVGDEHVLRCYVLVGVSSPR